MKKILRRFYNKDNINCEEITALVQGPYNISSLENLEQNKILKNIIYSTWFDNSKLPTDSTLKFVRSKLPNVEYIYNGANIYYQIVSTLEGLKKVKTKYTFKLRSDEKYSNLDKVIKDFDPDKLMCANIYFRPIKYASYHISDHFFLGNTKILLETFTKLKEYFDIGLGDNLNILHNKYSAEQLIAIFYIVSHKKISIESLINKKNDKKFVYKVMKEYFDVFDVKNLKPYIIKHNHLSKTINHLDNLDKDVLIKYISKIQDIKN